MDQRVGSLTVTVQEKTFYYILNQTKASMTVQRSVKPDIK